MSPELEAKIRNVEVGSNGPLVAAGLRISVEAELKQAHNEALEEAAKRLESETGEDLAFWAGEIRKLKK